MAVMSQSKYLKTAFVGARFEPREIDRLDAVARANDRSRSAELRRAVRRYLDGERAAA